LVPAQALVVQSINDLTTRHGFGAVAAMRPTVFQSFSLKDDPAGLWVAVEGEEIVGTAFSWATDHFWFLAELFVSPDRQGTGIGGELLSRVEDHARKAGARNHALITFPFNTVSQGLYIRRGMFPRLPLYNVSISRHDLSGRMFSESGNSKELSSAPADAGADTMRDMEEIDRQALGFSRRKHHRHLIKDTDLKPVLFQAGGRRAGYAYLSPGGHIGPLAVADRRHMEAALRSAMTIAASGGSEQVSAFIAGCNEAALALAARLGMRITLPMVLASSEPFGDWAAYLPRNPGFM
jgi:GNAT superfamily N-acetyltransferase